MKTGAIGLRKAMIVGGTMELLGAITLGYGVSSTIQKGVAKINDPEGWACGYCDTSMSLFMVGMLSALFGAGMFLLMATFTSMPVSTTHSIVGAVVGATAVGIAGSYDDVAFGASSCNPWKGALSSHHEAARGPSILEGSQLLAHGRHLPQRWEG